MATRKSNLSVVENTADETQTAEQTPAVHIVVTDLQTLIAQQKLIAEQIKAAKAAAPKRDRLQEVIHRQTTSWESWIVKNMANRIKARVAAGQDRQEAGDQVVAFFLNLAQEKIDHEEMVEVEAREVEIQEETND